MALLIVHASTISGEPHPPELVELLREHQAEQEREREAARQLWQDGGWLFADSTGGILNPRTDTKRWKELLAAAGVRDARLHDARHTAATVCSWVSQNAPLWRSWVGRTPPWPGATSTSPGASGTTSPAGSGACCGVHLTPRARQTAPMTHRDNSLSRPSDSASRPSSHGYGYTP